MLGDSKIALRLVQDDERERIYITPLIDPTVQIGPASMDIRLGPDALVFANVNFVCIDPLLPEDVSISQLAAYSRTYELTPRAPLILHPGEFALAASLEYVRLPSNIASRLEGRSSYGRAGLLVHAIAGFIDLGFRGRITLELTNLGKLPLSLLPGTRIGQLCFFPCDGTVLGYADKREQKYSGALMTLAGRFFQDREFSWYRAAAANRRT